MRWLKLVVGKSVIEQREATRHVTILTSGSRSVSGSPVIMSEHYFYKYLGLKSDGNVRADFLENNLFRFTQPNRLNDPFEVKPRVLVEAYADEDVEFARQRGLKEGLPPDQIDHWINLFLTTFPRGRFTPEEFPGIPYPKGIHSMQEFDAHNAKNELDALLRHINNTYGIFCLTTSPDNLLMWSLYAESHKGMVVEFAANHPFFANSEDLHPVDYNEKRISLSSNDGYLRLAGEPLPSGSDYRELAEQLFLRKHPDWKYEQEWRIIKRLDQATCTSRSDPNVYLYEVPADAIRVVILGAQISDENRERVISLVRLSEKWSHLQILQAALSDSNFSLEFKEPE